MRSISSVHIGAESNTSSHLKEYESISVCPSLKCAMKRLSSRKNSTSFFVSRAFSMQSLYRLSMSKSSLSINTKLYFISDHSVLRAAAFSA